MLAVNVEIEGRVCEEAVTEGFCGPAVYGPHSRWFSVESILTGTGKRAMSKKVRSKTSEADALSHVPTIRIASLRLVITDFFSSRSVREDL